MTPETAATPVPTADDSGPATMRYWLVRVAISERGDRTWARESTFSVLDLWVVGGGVLVAGLALGAALAAGSWNMVWLGS